MIHLNPPISLLLEQTAHVTPDSSLSIWQLLCFRLTVWMRLPTTCVCVDGIGFQVYFGRDTVSSSHVTDRCEINGSDERSELCRAWTAAGREVITEMQRWWPFLSVTWKHRRLSSIVFLRSFHSLTAPEIVRQQIAMATTYRPSPTETWKVQLRDHHRIGHSE